MQPELKDWGDTNSRGGNSAGHESLKHILRLSLKVMRNLLSLALIMLLVIAWLVSDPILRALGRRTHKTKQKAEKQNLKERLLTNRFRYPTLMAIISASTTIWLSAADAQLPAVPIDSATGEVHTLETSNTNIWLNGIGNGFKAGVQSVGFGLGAGDGIQVLGGRQSHDLALASVYYGYMLGSVVGSGHWYRGNWELRGELFSGAQFSPSTESLVGLTPHLRYNFATGSRWIPYADIGAGVSATSIGQPDLSGTFEFNLQAATGVRWFIRDNLALGLEARYLHMSCAGIHPPNLGLNNVNGMLSLTWFF